MGIGVAAGLALAAGCTGAGGGAPATAAIERLPGLARAETRYLVDPLEGFPLGLSPEMAGRLSEAHRSLLEVGDESAAATARRTAQEVLATDPGLPPALVLEAQAAFALGLFRQAEEGSRAATEGSPGYLAAGLLLGRAAERLGEVSEAYAAFREVAAASPLAAERAEELAPRAFEVVANRVRDELRRGRLEEAGAELALLERWAPGEIVTLEVASEVARARGDEAAELATVRELAKLSPGDPRLRERQADLELDAGDPSIGLEILEGLVAEEPGDPVLEEKLAFAKFRWRLTLLPARVQEVAAKTELERGDLAVLLYWLFPSVRFGEVARPRIAADILDDPRREEIARVINLGLMQINETLHRFGPAEPATRREVLAALLQILAAGEPPAACTREMTPQPSAEQVCATAARCGLLPRPGDCLPEGPISGREALGFLRLALERASS